MTLTKADLADLLFEQVGLNKREAKDMVEAFFEEVRQPLKLVTVLNYQVLVTLNYVKNLSVLAVTQKQVKKYQFLRVVLLLFTPAKN